MIRVVCDINVLVSAFAHPNRPIAHLLVAWLAGRFELVISEHLLNGLATVCAKPYFAARLSPAQQFENLALLRRRGNLVAISRQVSGVAPDEDDDLILSTALSGGATYLITGDRRFRQLGAYGGVTLLTPVEFLALLDPTTV